MARASLFETTQIAPEVTPGVVVPADTRLRSLGFELQSEAEFTEFIPKGFKLPTIIVPNRQWGTGSIEGYPTFSEIVYALSGAVKKVTPVLVATSTGAYRWVFDVNPNGPDVVQTFTLEGGQGATAYRMAHALFPEFGLSITRGELAVSGAVLGHKLDEDGVTLTAAPTDVDLVPMLPTQFDIYIDDTFAGLGTTKVETAFSAEFMIGSRFEPVWYINSADESFGDYVEVEPEITLALMLEASGIGLELGESMTAGETKYIRIQATGPEVEATFDHELIIDFAGKINQPSPFNDQDGVTAKEWTFRAVEDTDISGFTVEVVNGVAAL